MANRESVNVREPDADGTERSPWTVGHGEALRALRIERGLRQQELADAIDQPRTVLSNWENAIRVPSAAARRALAAALQVETSALETPADANEVTPDRWSVLRAQLDGLIDDGDKSRVDRFMRQSDVFAELADNEPGALRWNRLHSAAQAYRAELTALTAQSGSTPAAARAIGQQLASQARNQLGLSTSPLPTLTAAAEQSGVHVFIVYLRHGPRGRIRAIGAEHEALGVTALVNAAMDDRHRLFAFAELVGRLLFHPRPASAILAAHPEPVRGRRPAQLTAAHAFAAELVLPAVAVQREASLADTMTALEVPRGKKAVTQTWATLLADLLQTYRVTVPVALSQLDDAWRVSDEEKRQLLFQPASAVWRTLSTIKHAGTISTPTVSDLPTRFLALLVGEVTAGRSSLQGAAELAGIDMSELQPMLTQPRIDLTTLDDGWLDESGVAVA